MQDFTAGSISATPNKTQTTGNPKTDELIKQLVCEWECTKSCELIEEMIITALKMGRDQTTTAVLKLFNRSLKELRYAARVFAPYRHVHKVVVFGSARTKATEPEAVASEEFARRMHEELGYMTITGGGDGIMGAAQRGAGRENSFGLNIRLPFEQRANETIHGDPKLINFNYFFTRKLNFLKETHAVALFPGGFGTMDEGFEVLTLMQTGKARIIPVVLVDRPGGTYWKTWIRFLEDHLLRKGLISEDDFSLFKMCNSVDEAVAEIAQFYKNFHNYRWVGQKMVIRMHRPLTEKAVESINAAFDDIFSGHHATQGAALPEEHNEPDIEKLPRLICTPKRKNFGRFRKLIDAVNAAETVS
ncbi:MAG: LOG family protein [Chthoniobacter sp.]|uniref:LOG family protein n=1 Tax=Chthoniobacter sp. TaxID=2510640 RepID=UPI0032A6D738